MGKQEQKQVVEFIKKFLRGKGVDVSVVALFGSRVNGRARTDSDLDVAIVSKSFEKKDIFVRVGMVGGLHWALVDKFSIPFDIVYCSPSDWRANASPIVNCAKEQGIAYS
jgi:predicted nucleotidyltransferase